MILRQFPDLQWLKQQAEKSFADRRTWDGQPLPQGGWPTVILNATTTQTLRDNIRGPLSLFTNLGGRSTVTTNKQRTTIPDDFFLLSNHDQYYTLEVDGTPGTTPTQTFNIHFGEYFGDQVFASLTQRTEHLLENSFQHPSQRIAFHNTLHHRSASLTSLLLTIKNQPEPDPLWLEEKLALVMEVLLDGEMNVRALQTKLPALKTSTRTELLKRLLLVRDYIFTYLHRDLSLDELAFVACLSKFHFLRLFKLAYDQTPYQFINAARIRQAQRLLHDTSFSVVEISKAVGFSNASSFSRMFFQQTGVYPSAIRRGRGVAIAD